MYRRIFAALAVAGSMSLVGATAAQAYQIPSAADFQSGNWDLDLRPQAPVEVSSFSDPNFGSDLSAIIGTGSGRVVYDRSTNPDGSLDSFTVSVGGTCYVGCRTGHAGGTGS